ncbi:DUF6600 domain-containing protein [Ideonella sp.]|uniref:DUF6600 domain-containing protein n=1 Tax=Ideonella sp. TaxID=1929293 RepID=UPI003BB7F2F2
MHAFRWSSGSKSLVLAFALISALSSAWADPPARVARLGFVSGALSFSPAGEADWDEASMNRPLTSGDRLWSEPGTQAELQMGGTTVRLAGSTSLALLNLDDTTVQLQLTEGRLNVQVARIEPGQVVEVDTPNLAFTVRQPGNFRIEVAADGQTTTLMVRQGEGEAEGEGARYRVPAGAHVRFTGTGLRNPQRLADLGRGGESGDDDFDRWARGREAAVATSVSARYVSRDVVGYQDLDDNGSWRQDASLGPVWTPSRVAADWAPYRDGHWSWVDPWGWTWVDDHPWGFAVSHYGRWAHLDGRWAWLPGPVRSRAHYAPALVVFAGGAKLQVSLGAGAGPGGGAVGGVAWFPLGPRELYRPAYPVSQRYFEGVNRGNTVVNNTVIINNYKHTDVTKLVYINRKVPGAMTAVPTDAFVNSRSVARSATKVSAELLAGHEQAVMPNAVPVAASVHGAAAKRKAPEGRAFERVVVARVAPPPARASFAAQAARLAAKQGKPLDDADRKALQAPERVAAGAAGKAAATPASAPTVARAGMQAQVKVLAKTDQARQAVRKLPAMAEAAPKAAVQAASDAAPKPKPEQEPKQEPKNEPKNEARKVLKPEPLAQPEPEPKVKRVSKAAAKAASSGVAAASAAPRQPIEKPDKTDKAGKPDKAVKADKADKADAAAKAASHVLAASDKAAQPPKPTQRAERVKPVRRPVEPASGVAPIPVEPPAQPQPPKRSSPADDRSSGPETPRKP